MMKSFLVFLSAALLVLACASPAMLAQEKHPGAAGETDARVPELESFHATIYKLWHTAWPKKDVAMLTELVPEIKAGAATVAGARLPGILQDKKEAWTKGVQSLQGSVEAYEAAALARDSVRLLHQAEELHSQYEGLVRIIRPPMKELYAFHADLYMLYHHYGPAFDLPGITTSAAAMKETMAALNAAALPARYASRQDAFAAARATLSRAVDRLQEAVKSGKKESINAAIESVHHDYVALEKVFE
jgi:hypothetical protein